MRAFNLFLGVLTLSATLITDDAKQSLAQTSTAEADCSEATLDRPGSDDIAKIAATLNDIWKLKVRLFVCPNRLDGVAYATSDGTVYFHDGREITLQAANFCRLVPAGARVGASSAVSYVSTK